MKPKSEVFNIDCLDYMRGLPDNAFELAIAIFYFGLMVGGWLFGKRLADATGRAILESDLTGTQQMELLDKIKEYAKEGK